MSLNHVFGVLLIRVQGGNPNGGLDNGGGPRELMDGCGIITPVCLKRKIRDWLVDPKAHHVQQMFKDLNLNPENFHIFESEHHGFYDLKDRSDRFKALIKLANEDPAAFYAKYYDARLFGYTLVQRSEGKDDDRQTSDAKLRGPLTLAPAYSVAPIEVYEEDLFRCFGGRKSEEKMESGNILSGALKFVRHGIYASTFSFTSRFHKNTDEFNMDLEVLKYILPRMFDYDASSSRPAGSVYPIAVYWIDHGSPSANKSLSALQQLIPKKVSNPQEPSISDADYEFPSKNVLEALGAIDLVGDQFNQQKVA